MIKKYILLCRFDHAIKHLFVIPGIFFAILLIEEAVINYTKIILGFFAAILVASANYVINEYLDSKNDNFHPLKKSRVAVNERLNLNIILFLYFSFNILGFLLGYIFINKFFLYTLISFSISGLLYNVKPFRLKNLPYIDVMLESINNPIRFFLGWFIVIDKINFLPPISFILFYWFAGGFLMSSKRLAEYRYFQKFSNLKKLVKYRVAYLYYDEIKLIIFSILLLMLSSFNIAVFLIKYREELILIYPLICLIFCYYFYITLKIDKLSLSPEKIYVDKKLFFMVGLLIVAFILVIEVDIKIIQNLLRQTP